ncbi:DNA methyltransferase [Mycoplasma sp. 2248]|uniref:DNA methyltransferase n=1 Tax=Mycoplasma sp. 2248 TaxID=3108528 RepID=UPI002B1E1512|nr:DNA methyltransferase [Mycoplasma sp. 2248]MEA4190915.1 DNA methyltransferase [Mycoplasma sp. 2248]
MEKAVKKLVIWALYDDAESSYKNAIKEHWKNEKYDLEVHSVGINDISFPESDKYFYHKIDLSITNFNLISELKQLPTPDIILASPPCESWSGADCNGKMFRKIDNNGNWVVKNSRFYDEYNKTCHPVKRRYFEQKERGRILGEATVGGTIKIIRTFKPKVWVVENPSTSKTWEFQKNHWDFMGFENKSTYSAYDSRFSLKPTIFKSNIKLHLISKSEKRAEKSKHMSHGSYAQRSKIPHQLIIDMVNQVVEYIDKDKKEGHDGR